MLDKSQLEMLVGETYALHTIITNVGIDPSEVSVTWAYGVNLKPPGYCAVMIVERGDICSRIPVARLRRKDCHRYLEAWHAFCLAKKSLSLKALDLLLYGSAAWEMRSQVLAALAVKGFHLTAGPPN